jgi:DNA-binding response OmpR family regulator
MPSLVSSSLLLSFCKVIRREPQFAHIPILVLTAQSGLQNKLKSFEAGADDHLTKPFEPVELAARLAALLRRTEISQKQAVSEAAHEDARLIAVHAIRVRSSFIRRLCVISSPQGDTA